MTLLAFVALLFLEGQNGFVLNRGAELSVEFSRIKLNGRLPGFRAGEKFQALDRELNFNHFQGIQRLRGTNYLFLSSNAKFGALLHVVRMGSMAMTGRFGSNMEPGTAEEEDRIVLNLVVSEEFNHAGGIQIVDDILAVPLEDGVHSKVVFYDLENPEAPKKLKSEIVRRNKLAGAVAICKPPAASGFFLIIVKGSDLNLDVYHSSGTDLNCATFELKDVWTPNELKSDISGDFIFGDYQNINLIRDGDDRLYLVGMHNNTRSLLRLFSSDYADLFRVEFKGGQELGLTKIARKSFVCKSSFFGDRFCNFDAGAGVYLDPKDGLMIYAVDMEPDDGIVRFVEFSNGR